MPTGVVPAWRDRRGPAARPPDRWGEAGPVSGLVTDDALGSGRPAARTGCRLLPLVSKSPDARDYDHAGEQTRTDRVGTGDPVGGPGTARRMETLEGEAHTWVIERAGAP